VGTVVLLTDQYIHDLADVAIWLGAAIALHDGLLAPLVLACGLLLTAAVRPIPARRIIRGAFLGAGSLTLVALPRLTRPGPRANPTVLPLDYLDNWLLLLAITAAVTGLLLVLKHRRAHRPPKPTAKRTGSHEKPRADG